MATASQADLMMPDELPDLLEDPEFQALKFEDRKKVFEAGVNQAASWMRQNGGWTPEEFTDFRKSVGVFRQRVNESESGGEWAMDSLRTIGGVLKDSAATIGTTAADLRFADAQDGDVHWRAPLSDVGPALVRNMDKLTDSVATAQGKTRGGADEALEAQLADLDAAIDRGDFLQGDPKAWLKGRADAMEWPVRAYWEQQRIAPESEAEFLKGNRLDSPKNMPHLMHYIATGNPQAREQLRANLLKLPHRARMEARDEQLTKESDTGQFLDDVFGDGASRYVGEAGDPLELFGNITAFFGGKAFVTAGKAALKSAGKEALKATGKGLLGAAGETVSEMGSLFMDDPDATAKQFAETAKEAAIGSLGLAGIGGVVKVAQDRFVAPPETSTVDAVMPATPLAPGQEGASDADFDGAEVDMSAAALAAERQASGAAGAAEPVVTSGEVAIPAKEEIALPATESSPAAPQEVSGPAATGPQPGSPGAETAQEEGVEASQEEETVTPPPLPAEFRGAWEHGVALVKQGMKDFAAWSVEMVKRFGEAIREYLKGVWEAASKSSRVGAVGSVSPGEIERRVEAARAAATMPNRPDSESGARPLQEPFGGEPQQYTAFRNKEHASRARGVVDAIDSLEEMARLLSSEDGVRSLGLGQDLHEYVVAETLRRAAAAVDAAANDVDRIRATQTMRRVKSLWDVSGTAAGQQMAARKLAGSDLFEPMAVDDAIDKQQKETIERALPVEPVKRTVEKAAGEASAKATEATADAADAATPRAPRVQDDAEAAKRAAERVLNTIATTHADPQIWKDKSQPHPVVLLYREHLAKPMSQEEFAARLQALQVPPDLAATLAQAANLELEARAAIEAAKDQQTEIGRATAVADGILDRIAETHADPQRWPDKSKPHPVASLYRQHVENPMGQDVFKSRLLALGVDESVADRLARAAEMEIGARADVARAKAEMKESDRAQMADAQAGKLIYEVSQQHRQAGTPLVKGPHKDTIRSIFRELVNKGMPFAQFADRLRKLRVSEVVIERLYRVAQRERMALDEAAAQQARQRLLAQDSPGLVQLLKDLASKITGGLRWRDIFTSLPTQQRQWELEVYRRIRKHQALQGLTPAQAMQLTREMSKAWLRERRAVFNRELNKQLAKVVDVKPGAAEKVKAAAPRLLQLINLGAFDSATFRDALAQEWGIKSLASPEAKRLREIAVKYQQTAPGVAQRKLAQEFIEGLQDLTKLTGWQILDSWWTGAVLSGWRTIMDIWLSVANGIEDVGLGAIVTAFRGKRPDVAFRAVFATLGHLPTAVQEALQHLFTGDRSMMQRFDEEAREAMDDGQRLASDVGRQLWTKGGWWKGPGGFIMFLGRVLTMLDHITTTSTREGAKWMAMARHPDIYDRALQVTARERENARAQARNELTAGVQPKTHAEKLQEDARVREILEQNIPKEIIAEASSVGLEAAFQGDPTGLGWAVWKLAQLAGNLPGMGLDLGIKAAEAFDRRTAVRVLAALKRASVLMPILAGSKFARSMGHFINRSVSYVPGVGMVRWLEGGMRNSKMDILLAKQVMGLSMYFGVKALFAGRDDDEMGIEGSWKGLDANQRAQLLQQGKQPNTIWYRDDKGAVRSFNFMQWGVANVLSFVGNTEDQRRYRGNADSSEAVINAAALGLLAVGEKTQMQGLFQTLFMNAGPNQGEASDQLAKKLIRWASNTGGGLVPRVMKDVDALFSPALRDTSDTWALWAQHVPMVRELASGKRIGILGNDVEVDRGPLSRITTLGPVDPAFRLLGRMNERDLWLPDPSAAKRRVKLSGHDSREMSTDERDRYQRKTAEGYRAFVVEHGEKILAMKPEQAKKFVSDRTEIIRNRAAWQAVRR